MGLAVGGSSAVGGSCRQLDEMQPDCQCVGQTSISFVWAKGLPSARQWAWVFDVAVCSLVPRCGWDATLLLHPTPQYDFLVTPQHPTTCAGSWCEQASPKGARMPARMRASLLRGTAGCQMRGCT